MKDYHQARSFLHHKKEDIGMSRKTSPSSLFLFIFGKQETSASSRSCDSYRVYRVLEAMSRSYKVMLLVLTRKSVCWHKTYLNCVSFIHIPDLVLLQMTWKRDKRIYYTTIWPLTESPPEVAILTSESPLPYAPARLSEPGWVSALPRYMSGNGKPKLKLVLVVTQRPCRRVVAWRADSQTWTP